MERIKAKKQKLGWHIAGAAIAPFIVMSLYLFLRGWSPDKSTAYSDYVGLAFSILIGAIFIARLPIHVSKRVLLLLIYIPVLILMLFCFTLIFVCSIFGACL
jgi:hypothetical protein